MGSWGRPGRGAYGTSVTVLILASASPARLNTLRAAGIEPEVIVSNVDESAVDAGGAAELCGTLARLKAEAVAGQIHGRSALVLGCDSVLDLDGEALGKPGDPAEASRRWRAMRGRSGVLHTGHWLVDSRTAAAGGTGATLGAVASTVVHFADVTDAEIDAYVATGEPLAVAGAFTVDGRGGAFVRGIEGDHHNVVGVSLPLLRELLAEVGVPWPALWR